MRQLIPTFVVLAALAAPAAAFDDSDAAPTPLEIPGANLIFETVAPELLRLAAV